MRRLVAIVLAWLAVPALALARPKVAVAPIDGDDDGAIAAVVADAAADHGKVTGPKGTAHALDELGLSDARSAKAQKKLRKKLGVDVVIAGKVERAHGKSHLTLAIARRGKKPKEIELTYKSASSKKLHRELRDALGRELEGSEDEAAETGDDDEPRHHSDDAEPRVTKRRHHHRDDDVDEPPPRNVVTQSALWLDAGAAGLHRTLTYGTTANATPPPPVGTGSFSGELDAELYPFAFDSLRAQGAGLGFYARVAKTVGLAITVPGTAASAPIDEAHYELGARYRFTFGSSSVAIGASYWRHRFIADRSRLPMGTTLDMPDVDYTAIAPGAVVRYAATPTIGVLFEADVPLMLASGAITDATNFGRASVVAFALEAALDVALAPHYGLRFAALFDQEGLSFVSPMRGVSSATDRTMGVTATFAIVY